MKSDNSPEAHDENERTIDLSDQTKPAADKAEDLTIEADRDSLRANTTDTDNSAVRVDTVQRQRPSTLAEGDLPDTFLAQPSEGPVQPVAVSHGAVTHRSTGRSSVRSSKAPRRNVPSLVGRQIGEYRIDSELGRGGMGVVYQAHHQKLKRDVAIKMILGAGASDQQTLERFEVEARAVASLKHQNFVQLFEFGSFEGSPYFALEYVEGGTLADGIKETPLDPSLAAQIIEKMARAMQVAHDQGILHRDLKPANVLLAVDGEPKITDFGLAKQLLKDNDQETKAGTVMGTPSFMSPEQAMGQISELTGATDQYSLGSILYACISGRPPFMSASTIDTITQVVHKEPIPPRQLSASIPIDLETICLKTLHKEADKRYASCAELADDLRRFLNGEPIMARPISKVERAWRWCKRNPRVAIPSSLAGLFILLTAGVSSWAWATTSAQAAVIAQERDNVESERDEAQKQRDEARRQTIIADQQRAAAEKNEELAQKQADLALKNIQFIVTDVDKKLKELPGSSEIRIGILESVADKWDELDVELAGGVRGQAIPTLMAVRQLIAIAFQDLDRLKEAQAEFAKLEDMARERIALKGRTDATRSNLARILFISAPLSRRLESDPQTGLRRFEEALELVREIIRDPQPQENSPSENEILQLLGSIAQNMGVELLREGRIAETEQAFSEALQATSKVMDNIRGEPGFDSLTENQRDTKTAGLQINLDKMRMGLAYIRLRMGKTEEALPLYQEAIASRREIFDRRATMLVMKTELAGHAMLYGKSLMWLERLDDALPLLRESAKLFDEAQIADPEKAQIKRSLADSLYLFGWLRRLQEQPDEAIALLERSRILRAELSTASADEKNQINLMLSEASVGNVDAAKKICDALAGSGEANGELHLYRAMALAEVSRHVDGDTRDQFKNEALDALERSLAEGFSDPFRIRTEPELRRLRGTERFNRAIKQLAEAAKVSP